MTPNESNSSDTRNYAYATVRRIPADTETPVSTYLKIACQPWSFLLESVERADSIGRYSFLGADASVVFRSKGHDGSITRDGAEETFTSDDPMNELRALMKEYDAVPMDGLPEFHGGAVGYLSYDQVRFVDGLAVDPQHIHVEGPRPPTHDPHAVRCCLEPATLLEEVPWRLRRRQLDDDVEVRVLFGPTDRIGLVQAGDRDDVVERRDGVAQEPFALAHVGAETEEGAGHGREARTAGGITLRARPRWRPARARWVPGPDR